MSDLSAVINPDRDWLIIACLPLPGFIWCLLRLFFESVRAQQREKRLMKATNGRGWRISEKDEGGA